MEIDELKNAWSVLDSILMKNKSLQSTIIKEMLQSKVNKSLKRLINFELMGAVICFIMFPVLFFIWGKMRHNIFADITIYVGGVILLIGWVAQPYKLFLLSKIDFSKAIAENVRFVQRYNLFIKKEKMYTYSIIPIVFGLVFVAFGSFGKIEIWRWAAVISGLVFTALMSFWQYRKIYNANIQSIMHSLDELKEIGE